MIPPHISDTEEMRKLRAELQKQEKEILRRGVLLKNFLLETKQLKKLLLRVTEMVTWNEYKILRKEIEEVLKGG